MIVFIKRPGDLRRSAVPTEPERSNNMARFEYHRCNNEPNQVFEGDRLKREGEYVEVIRFPQNGETAATKVAIIHLEAGEFVKELE
jgi:hypothetical protein